MMLPKSGQKKIMDQISTIIDEENLTSVIDIIENQINESDYTAMDIAAAFFIPGYGCFRDIHS